VSTGRPSPTTTQIADSQEIGKWEQLLARLESGDCTPFLGAGACAGMLPLASELASRWAERYGYPLSDRMDLHQVMQYVAVSIARYSDPSDLKRDFIREHFGDVHLPDGVETGQVHLALARFPKLSHYLTTNYDDLMTLALRLCQRRPVVGISPWQSVKRGPSSPWYFDPAVETWRDRSKIPASWRPTPDRPLVFHLHGHHTEPRSLVLTEDDYVDYLVRFAVERQPGKETSLLSPYVYEILAEKPLLFVGYSLQDWTFRVLFRTLLRNTPKGQRRKHVSVQLPPPMRPAILDGRPRPVDDAVTGPPDGEVPEDAVDVAAKTYLTKYFTDQDITVFWESSSAFARKLQTLQGGPAQRRTDERQ
jgi:hypothetical protein